MADVTRQSDVGAGAREGGLLSQQQQQPVASAKAKAVTAFEQQRQQEQEQARLAATTTPTTLAPAEKAESAAAVTAPTPTPAAPARPSALAITTPPSAEEALTKTATRPVEAIPAAHPPPGAGLAAAAAVASSLPAAVLRHAPAMIAGPLAATAAQAHIPGGGAAAVRIPMAAVGRTITTTWGECDPSVKSLVANAMAGAYGATIAGVAHPPHLTLSSPSRASSAERSFAANVTWDGGLLYLRGRERARVAPRIMAPLFESATFVPHVVTLALVGSSPATAAAVTSGEWGPAPTAMGAPSPTSAGAGGGGGLAMAPAGATAAEPTSPTAAGAGAGAGAGDVPPGLGRIDVEGTLYLMIKPQLRRLLPFGLGRALVPIDVPVSGVWSIVARPADDKILSFTDRPANWFKPPRALRALWGMVVTNVALVFTRW